jgi:hypothetical protein
MSLEICVLASDSAGNAAILRSPAGILLIDAGIGPRTLAKRLDGTGVRPTDIAALCLTSAKPSGAARLQSWRCDLTT